MPEAKKKIKKSNALKAVFSFKNFLKKSTEDSFFHEDINETSHQTD